MAFIPSSGSVVAFQSNPSVLQVLATVANPGALSSVSGTVGASVIGLTPVAVTNIPSISGTVLVNNGSVVAFQGGVPWAHTNVGSIITVGQGSVAAVIIGGSIAASFTPPANQSVSGTVEVDNTVTIKSSIAGGIFPISGSVAAVITNANVNVSGSVAAWLQSSNASVITVGTAAPNQSVSGTVEVDNTVTIKSSIAGGIFPISGSVSALITNFPTSQNVSGSVVAFQGTTNWTVVSSISGGIFPISGSVAATITNTNINVSGSVVAFLGNSTNASVITVGTAAANQSVSGTVGASIIGTVPITQSGTLITSVVSTIPSSVLVGASIFGALPGGNAVIGAVAASISGTVAITQSGTWISSIVNTVPSSVLVGVSVFGLAPVNVTNTNLNVGGSVVAFQGSPPWAVNIGSSVLVTGINVGSVSGTVGASIVGQLPAGTAMLGSVVAYQGVVPWVVNFQNSSIIGVNAGSVVALSQGSVITLNQGSSIIAINAGSVIAVPSGSVITVLQSPSIVGTYAEDSASTTADKGVFVLGVRNDTISSLVSADLDYGAYAQDSAGRQIIKPFVSEDATVISYIGSIVSGSVQLIQASVIGKKSYVTDFILSNTGATTTLVTLQGGDTSILGQFIAPTGGGMVATGINIPLKTTLSQDLAFKVSPNTSVLYLTVKGYQAP